MTHATTSTQKQIRERREKLIARNWSQRGYQSVTIINYLRIIRRLRPYLVRRGRREEAQMTIRDVTRAVEAYSHDRGVDFKKTLKDAKAAVRAWAEGLRAIGVDVPPWKPPQARDEAIETLLGEYRQHRWLRRGVTHSSLTVECRFVRKFLHVLKRRRRAVTNLALKDIDGFISELGRRLKPKTIAGACSALRSFLRFLHASGRVPEDLSSSVIGPLVGVAQRPPRVLPWGDVQRIIAAIDQQTVAGKRDFALLLMMAAYGLGAAEVLSLKLDDIDWEKGTIRIVRQKTGVEILLPLLQPVACALVAYLRNGRPRVRGIRTVFLRLMAPVQALSGASAICCLLQKYATATGVTAPFLGSHALRHSHASRQVDQGVPPKVISEILGHTDPRSVSTYTRVAMKRLRLVSLPVPL